MSEFTTLTWERANEIIASHTVVTKSPELCRAPKISVILHTYQQLAFIRQAMDSILMQECDFEYEIVVGDDGSSDGSYEILLEYQQRHPDKIVLLHTKPRLGKDGGYGSVNLLRSLRTCRGEFFALLEGDDYWSHPKKLQTQIDLLTVHPECSGSYHDVDIVGDWGGEPIFMDYGDKKFINFEDQLTFQPSMTFGSLVARRALFDNLIADFINAAFLDRYFVAQMAWHGPIVRAPGIMGAYRRHQGGITVSDLVATYDAIYRSWEFHRALKKHFTPRADDYYDYLIRFTFARLVRKSKNSNWKLDLVFRTLCAAIAMGLPQTILAIREMKGKPNPYARGW